MYQDDDPTETSEWLDALESLIENEGVDRARFILPPHTHARPIGPPDDAHPY